MADEYRTFEEFWPFYVREHSHPVNRALHFVGTSAAMALVASAVLLRRPKLALLAPLAGYGFAWVGHFGIEKNKPATFKYPAWSLRADFVMWSKIVTGQMGAEIEKAWAIHEAEQRAREETAARDEQTAANGVPTASGEVVAYDAE
ncbi:MAG: DUF962 domain-containing protein [Polyangiaceae bacterium]